MTSPTVEQLAGCFPEGRPKGSTGFVVHRRSAETQRKSGPTFVAPVHTSASNTNCETLAVTKLSCQALVSEKRNQLEAT